MEARTPELTASDLELWTLDDAEAWREAELGSASDAWLDDDPLLDNELWMDDADCGSLSIRGLSRLGIRVY